MSLSNSHLAKNPQQSLFVNLLLLLAVVLLFVGVWAPLLTLEKFYVFANTVSLLSALDQLRKTGEWGLFALVGGFSVLFPLLKLMLLAWIWNFEPANTQTHQRHLHFLETYGKWSMLDVFVVALLVVTVKLGAIAEVQVEFGIYVFASSVILTMLLSAWIGRQSSKHN